ncbi:hypothetical protein [Kitasatospora sp. NBC_01302]|uniref:hypothetical protein n=1 Tax=Kitasatospora sp. NBC_01302 TaxID=2903575 RepID=UPI002E12E9F2|nr:hypothetical protein OG294_08325 [Kitasatospora sp. NBC_01302]
MADSASIPGAAVPPPDRPAGGWPGAVGQRPAGGYDPERTAPIPAPVIEDAVPSPYRTPPGAPASAHADIWSGVAPAPVDLAPTAVLPPIEDAAASSYRRGGSEGTAVLRAVVPSPATAVLRAVVPPAAQSGDAQAPAESAPAPAAAPDLADEPPASSGWTGTFTLPPQGAAAPGAGPGSWVGGGLRGRILAVEGGYGSAGRRGWGRGGAGASQVLSAMLAAVAPQTLLAAESVDAVHLPAASDPQTVLAHLRAASRHPGPLLVHLGGHLVADKRGAGLYLTLRDSKTGTIRQDGLAWSAIASELRARPAEWDTLVLADLSAEQSAWPLLQGGSTGPFTEGLPLWAVVGPDPEQIGTFTRALIEALHGGRPGAGPLLTPEQLRAQVHSVLRPDVLIFASYGQERPVFRNTARQLAGEAQPQAAPAVGGPAVAAVAATVPLPRPAANRGPVSLAKPGVPPTVRPIHLVTLLKADAWTAPEAAVAEPAQAPVAPDPAEAVTEPLPRPSAAGAPDAQPDAAAPVPAPAAAPVEATPVAPAPTEAVPEPAAAAPAAAPEPAPATAPEPVPPPDDYREAIGLIVRTADAGEHERAADLALTLEGQAVTAHGAISAPVLMVRQVRAHVARLSGDPATASELYRQVALVLLAAEGPQDPEAQRVATNAEACWRAVQDPRRAVQLGPLMLELRAQLPGEDGRKLRSSERYLAKLEAAARAMTGPS